MTARATGPQPLNGFYISQGQAEEDLYEELQEECFPLVKEGFITIDKENL